MQIPTKTMKTALICKQISLLALAFASIPAWASKTDGTGPQGLPNFHQVNEYIYRGAQPTDDGWKTLAKLGVKTILDLRREDEHSTTAEAQGVEAAGMRYVNVPMVGVVAPTEEQMSKILTLLESHTDGPVFVHCQRGADRTGAVIACYRIMHDHWENQKALAEAKSDGMSWRQFGLKHYIEAFRSTNESAAAASGLAPEATIRSASAQGVSE